MTQTTRQATQPKIRNPLTGQLYRPIPTNYLRGFPRMAEVVRPDKQGRWEIDHFFIDPDEHQLAVMQSLFHGERYAWTPAGTYARLRNGGVTVMSDTKMERLTNAPVLWAAEKQVDLYGSCEVLIGGLGLGMLAHGLTAIPGVTKITIIEKAPEVITMITPTLPTELPTELVVVEADVLTWKPDHSARYDVVYFDIWNGVSQDNLPDMARLHQRFKKYKRNGSMSWMSSWRRDELRAQRKRDQEHDRVYGRFFR